jgi:transcriptional/translational regulatory protein YebC/TACO1
VKGGKIETASAEVTMVPSTYTKLEGTQAAAMQRLLDAIEDLDDTQNVYSNFEMDEESVPA